MPMNFSAIGANGGGGGGPATTTGAGWTGRITAGGGGGGAFGLNRNRFRSTGSGFGRSLLSASRCTTADVAAPAAPRPGRSVGAVCVRLDVGAGDADVAGHIFTITTARIKASAASASWRRRSVGTRHQAEIGGELHGQRQQRLGGITLRERDVVDDYERRRALQRIDELTEALVVALPRGVHVEHAKSGVLLVLALLEASVHQPDVALFRQRRQRRVGQVARRWKIGRQHFVEEGCELLVGARLAGDELARGGDFALG